MDSPSAEKITVLIAAYNAEKFLGRAIASAMDQTLPPFEILVVDDASADGTCAVVEEMARNDGRIRLVRLPANGGPAAARNAGIDAAQGDWIAILDADDAFRSGYLEASMRTAGATEADIILGNFRYYDANAGRHSDAALKGIYPGLIDAAAFIDYARPYRDDADMGLAKPVFRTAFLRARGLRYPLFSRHGEDFLLMVQALLQGARCAFHAEADYLYTTRSSGFSRTVPDYGSMINHSMALLDDERIKADPLAMESLQRRINALRRLQAERDGNAEGVNRKHLKKVSVRGAAVNFGTQGIKFALTFLNQVLLARMLVPEDFGLLAMVAPVMAFAQLFVDLGLTQATIQRQNITQAQLSFLFWLNFSAAATLAILMVAVSPLVGWFYHEPRVVEIAAIMGLTFLMSGLYTQQMAIFTRNMEFVKLALMDLCAFIIGMCAGLTAAACGLHYWALVTTHVTIYACNLTFGWTLSKWRPSRPGLPEDWRSLLGFGGNLTGFNIVNYFARNLDNVLIGRYNGETALGFYDRAYKLLLLPLTQISAPFSRVAMPLLSRMQAEPELYRKAYLRMIEMIMMLTYPGVIFAIVTSGHLITTVLGARWAGVAPIFAVLGFGALFAPIGQSTGWLFISQGRAREMRNYGVISSAAFVLSFIVGLPWGPLGVASCYIAVGTVQGPLLWWATTRKGAVSFQDIMNVVRPFATAGIACAFVVYMLDHFALPPNIFTLALNLAVAYLVFMSVMLAQPSGRGIVRELWRQAMSVLVPVLLKIRLIAPFAGRVKA